jgi:hypothetical protein
VFLDEFGKTTGEVGETLLKVTDSGMACLVLFLRLVSILLNLLQVCIEIAVRMATTLMHRSAYESWHSILVMIQLSHSSLDILPGANMRK